MKSWYPKADAALYDEAALSEQHFDSLIRLAFLKMAQEEAGELQHQIDQDAAGISVADMDGIFVRSQPEIYKLFDAEARKAKRARFLHDTAPRASQIAAVIVLVCFVAASTAVAASRDVRVRLMEFLVRIDGDYLELSLRESQDEFIDVPSEWTGVFYPSYIPEGFDFSHIEDVVYPTAFFVNDQGQTISFSEFDNEDESNVGIAGFSIRYIYLNAKSTLVATKNGITCIAWSDFDRYFVIRSECNEDETIRMASEMKRIR